MFSLPYFKGSDAMVFTSLPVIPLRVTSPYGPRNTGIEGASTFHKGIDLGRDKSKPETEILSVANGKVLNNYWNDTRGWVIIIQHDGFQTLSQHLKIKSPLKVGQFVSSGQVIGIMGASTKTIKNMSLHLHFELIANGKQIDPLPYLQNIKGEDMTKDEAKKIVKEKAGLDDKSIQFIADDYIYGEKLIIKLAEAMEGK